MKKVIGLVWGLVPLSVSAECVPSPDCASIGYTETSCDGGSVKCPFDTTKLKCIPCDSSFRYTCIGDNIKNPIGDTCNSKYAACECVAGATFTNGECVCDNSCQVGNIYYSDGTCSSCLDENKTIVGVVVKDNSLIMSKDFTEIKWSPDYTYINGVVSKGDGEAETDYAGKENTSFIVAYWGEDASDVAAVYCYNYAPENLEVSKGQWYLPAVGELNDYVAKNYDVLSQMYLRLGVSQFGGYKWSSTQSGGNSAWYVTFSNGKIHHLGKPATVATYCFLEV